MLSFLLCEVSSSVKFEVTQQAVILIQVLHAGEANKKLFQSTSVPIPVMNQKSSFRLDNRQVDVNTS